MPKPGKTGEKKEKEMAEEITGVNEEVVEAAPQEEPVTVHVSELFPEAETGASGADAGQGEKGTGAQKPEPQVEQQPSGKTLSQSEIDKGVSARVEAERRKYEPYRQIADMAATLYGVDASKPGDLLTKMREQAIEQKAKADAEKYGMNEEYLKDQYSRQIPALAEQPDVQARAQEVIAQAQEFVKSVPQFDLQKEQENPVFFTAVANGVSVEKAYYMAHSEEHEERLTQQIEQRIMQNLQAQKGAPTPLPKGRPTDVQFDIKNATPEQVAKIDRLIESGVRVRL